ncbi:MAG: ATP-dependent RNA helicase HrpA [Burkholderiaceae bacterium]
MARRIADELGSPLGDDVGYKVRFAETIRPGARFKIMTDGILLAETLGDPQLRQYDTLIIDEAHERSLNIDFLLGYVKQLLDGPRRDDLKVVITSATIDAERFARHFASAGEPAPVIEVSGRLYPVEIRYRADDTAAAGDAAGELTERALREAIDQSLDELWRQGPGDVLVFLPGEREIREVADYLRRARARTARGARGEIDIVPLFARLSATDQQKVFSASNGWRVVLATNVAETSLTVPGIRYVIDSGLARIKRYRVRSKVEQLQVEPVSQASANQRAGRCGRVANGIAIRLYSEQDYDARPRFTDPELLRSSLAGVILRMQALRLGDPEAFPFLDAPMRAAIVDGYALLQELGAVDEQRRLTPTGRQLARLPVDPRIGRMLLAGHDGQCLSEVLVIAAFLSAQDPRERPLDAQQAADQAHKAWEDPDSDFIGILQLWRHWRAGEDGRETGGESRQAARRRLEKQFLSVRRLREWADVEKQLRESVGELNWRTNEQAARGEAVHKALLSGLLGNLGFKAPNDKTYQGTHQTRFVIHPSSALTRRQPRWLMAAEMVDTGRLYARTNAGIQPGWIEQAAGHLIRRSWSDPVWSSKSAQAFSYERGVLYGLPVYVQRRVPLAARDPVMAREMLIRHALVADDWDGGATSEGSGVLPFVAHNRRLIADIEKLEHKIRRPDLLVDEAFLFAWFDARVPADVVDGRSLVRWVRKAAREERELLHLTRDALLRKDAAGVQSEDFPRSLAMRGTAFELDYHFQPGEADDGVTMRVPLALLNQVDGQRCEWLVPGLLADKVQALAKSLPQRLRRALVPVPAYAQAFIERHRDRVGAQTLVEAIRADIREQFGIQTQPADFRPDVVPAHLFFKFRLVDAHGRSLGQGRSLESLQAQHGQAARGAFREAFAAVASQLRQAPDAAAGATVASAGPAQGSATPVAGADPVPARLDGGATAPDETTARIEDGRVDLAVGRRFQRWPVESLPELLEIREPGAEHGMIGFPALVEAHEGVRIEVFDEQPVARARHRAGVLRLIEIALRDAIKASHRQLPDEQRLIISYARIGTDEQLRRDLTRAVLIRAVGDEGEPMGQAAFEALVAKVRPRISLIAQELARQLQKVLDDYGQAQRKLQAVGATAREPLVAAAVEDAGRQLDKLVHPGFLVDTSPAQFAHLPRYLQGIVLRMERVRADPARTEGFRRDLAELQAAWERLVRDRRPVLDPELERYRWLLEELRISLFAQGLRTPSPVSFKRLRSMLQTLQA